MRGSGILASSPSRLARVLVVVSLGTGQRPRRAYIGLRRCHAESDCLGIGKDQQENKKNGGGEKEDHDETTKSGRATGCDARVTIL